MAALTPSHLLLRSSEFNTTDLIQLPFLNLDI